MAKHGKRVLELRKKVDPDRDYQPDEALTLVKELASAKFDETIEAHLRMGVDPRHADQMVRGSIVLPAGTGKKLRVLAFATGEKVREAEEAGADYVVCLLALGRPEEATARLRGAREVFADLGAGPLAAEADALLQRATGTGA